MISKSELEILNRNMPHKFLIIIFYKLVFDINYSSEEFNENK